MTPSPSERLRTEAFWISWSDCAIGLRDAERDVRRRLARDNHPVAFLAHARAAQAVTFKRRELVAPGPGSPACRAPSASIANGISPCEACALPSTSAKVRGRLSWALTLPTISPSRMTGYGQGLAGERRPPLRPGHASRARAGALASVLRGSRRGRPGRRAGDREPVPQHRSEPLAERAELRRRLRRQTLGRDLLLDLRHDFAHVDHDARR